MKPAAPMGYPCADAALLVLVDAAVEVDEPELLEDRVVVPGVVAVAVVEGRVVVPELGVVAPAVGEVAEVPLELGLVPVLEPVPLELWPTQEVSVPELMVKGAEDAVAPVESRMVRPMDVSAAMLATHVTDSLLVSGKV
jgi:hypothetical protein